VIPELTSHENGTATELMFEMLLVWVVRRWRRDRVDVAKEGEVQVREIRWILDAEVTSQSGVDEDRVAIAW
jgi:hypothetical protein